LRPSYVRYTPLLIVPVLIFCAILASREEPAKPAPSPAAAPPRRVEPMDPIALRDRDVSSGEATQLLGRARASKAEALPEMDGRLALAQDWYEAGRLDDAEQQALAVLEAAKWLPPDADVAGRTDRARMLVKLVDVARANLRGAAVARDVAAMIDKGRVFYERGDYALAAQMFKEALGIAQCYPDVPAVRALGVDAAAWLKKSKRP